MSFKARRIKGLDRAKVPADRRTGDSNELTRRDFMVATSVVLASSAVFGKNSESPLANDRHRPRYHLMPPSAWLNDPNGPLFWKSQYHLFYQYASVVSNTATKHWAHAVSTDLVHWKNLG